MESVQTLYHSCTVRVVEVMHRQHSEYPPFAIGAGKFFGKFINCIIFNIIKGICEIICYTVTQVCMDIRLIWDGKK